jgi:hypothetical protein
MASSGLVEKSGLHTFFTWVVNAGELLEGVSYMLKLLRFPIHHQFGRVVDLRVTSESPHAHTSFPDLTISLTGATEKGCVSTPPEKA